MLVAPPNRVHADTASGGMADQGGRKTARQRMEQIFQGVWPLAAREHHLRVVITHFEGCPVAGKNLSGSRVIAGHRYILSAVDPAIADMNISGRQFGLGRNGLYLALELREVHSVQFGRLHLVCLLFARGG